MKFVRIAAEISFEELGNKEAEFEREFETFSETDSSPVDDFIQKMKAKDGKGAPDMMTITLLSELHKKIDDLTKLLKGEARTFLQLGENQIVDFAWLDSIKLKGLKSGTTYYARINLPLFRPRPIPFFFVAVDEENADITKMWPRDKADFDGYLMSKDREEIARERALQ
jgi:hypothetical protein